MVFDSVIQRMKNNSMIKSGLEVYNIAKEVYSLVNNKTTSYDDSPLNSAEEIYVRATHKVTGRSEKKIKSRIDYKVVHHSAQVGRKIKSVAVGVKKVIKKRYSRGRDYVYTQFKKVQQIAHHGYLACKKRILESRMMNSERVKSLKIQLYHYQNKINMLATVLYTQIDNFVGFDDCAILARKVTNDIKGYVNSIKNKAIEGKNIVVDVTTNNVASAHKMAVYSYGFAKQIVQADALALKVAFDTNRSLLIAYLKNLELEMYYSPEQSIKLIETIKNYANNLLNNETSDAVSHSSAREENVIGLNNQTAVVHA